MSQLFLLAKFLESIMLLNLCHTG